MSVISSRTKRDILTSWGSAGIAVVGCSPLEVIKMNAQVTPTDNTLRRMFKNVYRIHGIRGYYKGLVASLAAQPGYWTFYWPIYNALKPRYSNADGSIDLHKKIGIVFGSSLVASVAVNPLFVFKTRFQTSVLQQKLDGTPKHPNLTYKKLIQDIASKEGIRGFYKGNLVAQIKNTQMILQMPLFDYFNSAPWNPLEKSNFVLVDRSFVSGVVAKTIASCMVYYPIDCVRTNLRNEVENCSIAHIVKKIYKRPGGLVNFYRGVGVYWISAVPTFGVIMYAYERMQTYFRD